MNVKEIKPLMKSFFVNYLAEKCHHLLLEKLDAFQAIFKSSFEENWQAFVIKTLKLVANSEDEYHSTVSQAELDMISGLKHELQLIFNIITRLNIRKEIKNERRYLTQKVM